MVSYLLKRNAKKLLNDREYDYCFLSNSKYHYTIATNPNVLLAKFISKSDRDKFCLNYLSFETCHAQSHAQIMIMLNWKYLKSSKQF